MKILFVVPYPLGKAASQRYRVEQLLPLLQEQSIKYKIASFWSISSWRKLYKKGYWLQKVWGLLSGFIKRFFLLMELPSYDFVFVHREATPVGPPWFEWCVTKVFRKKLIFDFDDAIWLSNSSEGNQSAAKYKWHSKVQQICRWSYKVSCGNSYLLQYAQKYSSTSTLLPTLIDTANHYNQVKEQYTPNASIGWIGSHSTLPYLKLLEPVLQQLEQKYDFSFIVIADKKNDLQLKSLVFLPWQQETEIADLLTFNIGVMPLPDTEWAKGKCAFKALQYMALGIPAVVSAVGANIQAVPDGVTGYTCITEKDWYERLELLLQHTKLRSEMGKAGRLHVQRNYSVQAHQQTFMQLFT